MERMRLPNKLRYRSWPGVSHWKFSIRRKTEQNRNDSQRTIWNCIDCSSWVIVWVIYKYKTNLSVDSIMRRAKAYEIDTNCWLKIAIKRILLKAVNMIINNGNDFIFTVSRFNRADFPTHESPSNTNLHFRYLDKIRIPQSIVRNHLIGQNILLITRRCSWNDTFQFYFFLMRNNRFYCQRCKCCFCHTIHHGKKYFVHVRSILRWCFNVGHIQRIS